MIAGLLLYYAVMVLAVCTLAYIIGNIVIWHYGKRERDEFYGD